MKQGDVFHYQAPRGIQEQDPYGKPVWYGLTTPPQKERAAKEYIIAQGLHAFYPDEERRKVVNGKPRTVEVPSIPRLVFARFTGRPHWDVIKDRPFFSYSQPFQGTQFSRKNIKSLMSMRVKAAERRKVLRERLEAWQAALVPVAGEQARLIDGPLKGFLVDVTQVSGGLVDYLLPGNIKGQAAIGLVERETNQ